MNALYVTVSIPLLLVLAGFNHAHGLTTFGKTQNNQQQPPQPPPKSCNNHESCKGIQGTSCVPEPRNPSKMSCLCGDNNVPINGACTADLRGPKHMCTDTSQCVPGAECKAMSNKNGGNGQEGENTCKCMEGYIEHNSLCSGGSIVNALSGWILLVLATSTIVLSKQL